jgi:hypothetical protein
MSIDVAPPDPTRGPDEIVLARFKADPRVTEEVRDFEERLADLRNDHLARMRALWAAIETEVRSSGETPAA